MTEYMAVLNCISLTIQTINGFVIAVSLSLNIFYHYEVQSHCCTTDPFNTLNLFRKKRWRRDEHITNKFWESKTLKVLICRAVMRDLNFIMLKSEMEMSDISYHQNNNIIVEILNCYHIENN